MATVFSVPYPTNKVTSTFPDAEAGDGVASQAGVQLKRRMTGGPPITYPQSSDNKTLRITLLLTRTKAQELDNLVNIYQSAQWEILLYDETRWVGDLVGATPAPQTSTTRIDDGNQTTGDEERRVELTFTARQLT